MLLCFFLRAEESKKLLLLKDKKGLGLLVTLQGGTLQKGVWGYPPARVEPCKNSLRGLRDQCFGL